MKEVCTKECLNKKTMWKNLHGESNVWGKRKYFDLINKFKILLMNSKDYKYAQLETSKVKS